MSPTPCHQTLRLLTLSSYRHTIRPLALLARYACQSVRLRAYKVWKETDAHFLDLIQTVIAKAKVRCVFGVRVDAPDDTNRLPILNIQLKRCVIFVGERLVFDLLRLLQELLEDKDTKNAQGMFVPD